MLRHILLTVAALAAITLTSRGAAGQSGQVDLGDGRIHGAAPLRIAQLSMNPGQVQTVNLRPRFLTTLEFPVPVKRAWAGDADEEGMVTVTIDSTDVILNPTAVGRRAETNLRVTLDDAAGTKLTFLLRADSTQPFSDVIRFADPYREHLARTEQDLASRASRAAAERLDSLAEARARQIILFAGRPLNINRRGVARHAGGTVEVEIESAQEIPTPGGETALLVRYRVTNRTVAALEDLHFIARVGRTQRRFGALEETRGRELFDLEEDRTAHTVRAGETVRGILVLRGVVIGKEQWLDLEAVGFGDRMHVPFQTVLGG